MSMLPSLVCCLLSSYLLPHSFGVNTVAPGIASAFKLGRRKDRQSQPYLYGFTRKAKAFPETAMSSLTSHELEFGRSAEKMSIYLAYGCPKHSLNLLSKDTREHEHHVGNTSVCHIPQLLCIIFFWLVQLDGELLKTETMVITSLECFLASIIALRMSFLFTMFTY